MQSRLSRIITTSTALASLCALVVVPLACATDHDALAKRPPRASSNGGAGGTGAGGINSGGLSNAGSGGKPDFEPIGESAFTLVHGIVDGRTARICFAKPSTGDAAPEYLDEPTPEPRLSYGARYVVPAFSKLDVALENLQVIVIDGDLSLTEGLPCAAAVERAELEELPSSGVGGAGGDAGTGGDGAAGNAGVGGQSENGGAPNAAGQGGTQAGGAGGTSAGAGGEGGTNEPPPPPPRLRVRELPVIPAGILSGGRSYLLVIAGCMGGPAFTDTLQTAVCGTGYTPSTPTLRPILVNMSRVTAFGQLGLQTLNASLATEEIATRAVPESPSGESGTVISATVSTGEISPKPPNIAATTAQYGAETNWFVEVHEAGVPAFAEPWTKVLERGEVTTVEDGKTYAIIYIGPLPNLSAEKWWNGAALTIAPTQP